MPSKYRNKRIICDGIKFDSQKEAQRYRELCLMERAGELTALKLQPRYKLAVGGIPLRYPSGRQVTYVADFEYQRKGEYGRTIEDVKGMKTPVYKIKQAIMMAMGKTIVEI